MAQVIRVDQFGRIHGLVHKNGYDLTKLKAINKKVTRVSDINYSTWHQKWRILYLVPPYKGKFALYQDLDSESKDTGVMYFEDYQDAVDVEIELFNKFRTEGLIT